ncbi:TPA: phage baseplate assembly protein V [Vibrio parahaemolyticus]
MSEQLDQQKRTNTSNKMYGRYRAEVVNTEHPQGLYMVSVRVLGLWDEIADEALPYAEFELPLGAKPSRGHVVPVEEGDFVWVEFPRNGDTRYPLITGSVYHAPEYKSNLPDDVNGEAYQHKRSAGEPEPAAYDRKDDLYERFGLREQKSHTGGWQITHVASGTAIEITPLGECVIHTEGNQWRSGTGNLTEQFAKDVKLDVGGGQTITISKDSILKAKSIIETADSITEKADTITEQAKAIIEKADKIIMNEGRPDQRALRACDVCLITGIAHGQGSNTVFVGD